MCECDECMGVEEIQELSCTFLMAEFLENRREFVIWGKLILKEKKKKRKNKY